VNVLIKNLILKAKKIYQRNLILIGTGMLGTLVIQNIILPNGGIHY
jgi:hypothetical protein